MKRKTISVLLNLFLPPFGFYYLKDRKLFGWFYLFALFSGLVGTLLTYSAFVNGSGRIAIFFLILYIVSVWGLWIYFTLRSESDNRSDTFPSAYWFLPIAFLILIVSGILIDELFKDRILKAKIQLSSGMQPALNVNDSFYITELFYTKELKHGDIVAYRDKDSERRFLGRIVGLPGDKIEFSDELTSDGFKVLRTSVNGEKSPQEISSVRTEEWKSGVKPANLIVLTEVIGDHLVPIFETRSQPVPIGVPSLTLQENEFYVLGDNRDDSYDSRTIGPIDADRVAGKFAFTYLSADGDLSKERICDGNQDLFCPMKRIYKIIILQNILWSRMGYDNRSR
ncbi:signal peptidase I [Leptospira barantonii]|uniref:Signal peptidase I n=1 Tax=Leptospira barantonii TaxID=2023184 RepID=A0ABX4NM13_9LEPT|nr:signal peptidase I [Leptospira barantonii]PJZ57860.1 signal peptidase I [Leptospira barantonii]